MEPGDGFEDSAKDGRGSAPGKWPLVSLTAQRNASPWTGGLTGQVLRISLRPLQLWMIAPSALFLLALATMLLRHPDVPFYEIDRVAFILLVLGVISRAGVTRQRLLILQRATW